MSSSAHSCEMLGGRTVPRHAEALTALSLAQQYTSYWEASYSTLRRGAGQQERQKPCYYLLPDSL